MRKNLPLSVLVKTVFRGLFIQAAWNYENFQGIGFAYGLIPFLRKTELGPEGGRELLERHLSCFNTNPYMAGMVVGEILRLEEERLQGRVSGEEIETLKKDLTGALGALGDSLIWGAWRPLAGLIAVLAALGFERSAPLVFLAVYNGLTLWLRIAGVRNGYAYGADLLKYLQEADFQRKIFLMNGMILFATGALIPLWVAQAVPSFNAAYAGVLVLMGLLLWVVWHAERRRVPLPLQAAGLLVLSGILAYSGWIGA